MASELNFELAHVLFLDVVGYSRLLIDDQREVLRDLNTIVRSTAQFRDAEAQQKLICVPTGDGMVIAFFTTPDAAARCAIEIARALRERPEIKLRMGIHCGPVSAVTDVNGHTNMAGGGVNMAQRVMNCGDAGHILLSQRVAEDLAQFREWHSSVHELGESEIKHGTRIRLFNFWNEEIGNRVVPKKLEIDAPAEVRSRGTNKNYSRTAIGLAAALLLLGAIFWFSRHQPARSTVASTPSIPEKSIAVLPFENLSEEKANAYFTNGVQDEILTDLAKIADLKVISRSSVMQYRTGITRNLRQIGQQLGVAHLLEGSVQRAEGKVRVNAQLIDARTDAHLWAQTYDRNFSDVFAIQSDIAKSIAEQLQARLAPEEEKRLATPPTDNSEAYLFYLQANEQFRIAASKLDVVAADELYAQAIALDPKFALARARASMLNSTMYLVGRMPERKVKARVLADEALRLAPNLGDAHVALGLCYYRIDRDYDAALKELAVARAASPNDSEILDFSGLIYRRQGLWREALAAFAHAQRLDPRRAHFEGVPNTLRALRQWTAAADAYHRSLELEPDLVDGWVGLAYVQFARREPPSVASMTLDHLSEVARNKPDALEAKWDYTMMARDFATADRIAPDPPANEFPAVEPKLFFLGCAAFASGDRKKAQSLLEQTLPLHEAGVRDHPEDPRFHAPLARVYALLGRKEEAIREARRAIELLPESKDAVEGPDYATTLAFVCAQTGEADEAISLLAHLLTTPSAERMTQAHLRLSWEWDPLRQDARFQEILEGPEPDTVYK